MSTKILLHGGYLITKDPRNDAYLRELTKDLEDGDEVLFIGFARTDQDERNNQYKLETQWLKAQTDKKIIVVNATHDNVVEQIKSAKSIQITGGHAPELKKDILNIPDFMNLVEGKTVGGSSAGACLFSKYYYYHYADTVNKGLGVFPIKLNVHNDNPEFGDSEVARKKLEEIDENLELLALDECEWVEKLI